MKNNIIATIWLIIIILAFMMLLSICGLFELPLLIDADSRVIP